MGGESAAKRRLFSWGVFTPFADTTTLGRVVSGENSQAGTEQATDKVEFHEGCLSLAGFSAIVPRALAVRVEYLDERGESCTVDASGWYARILQHEIDHLHGNLYIDRMLSRTFTSMENWNRYWKGKTVSGA